MQEPTDDIAKMSPHKLIENFSKSRVLPCIIFALALHFVVVGGTSINYISDTWIDPPPEEPAPGDKQPAPAKVGAAKPPGPAKPADPNAAELEKHKDAPVVKKLRDKANADEIPKEPSGLGISIDDTND